MAEPYAAEARKFGTEWRTPSWRIDPRVSWAFSHLRNGADPALAGEHTSIDFQGYLNGAVESGERCAEEILAALKWVAV